MNTTRYIAIWQVGGKELIVFPRSRKTHTFATVRAALSALERKARKHPNDSRGIIRTPKGEYVSSIQL